jgi:hypothetical protein
MGRWEMRHDGAGADSRQQGAPLKNGKSKSKSDVPVPAAGSTEPVGASASQ